MPELNNTSEKFNFYTLNHLPVLMFDHICVWLAYLVLTIIVCKGPPGSWGGNLHDEAVHGSQLLLVWHAQDGPLQLLSHLQCSI